MTQQHTPNLGETPSPDARRDAVHIAVAPVVCGVPFLDPGQHVGLDARGRANPRVAVLIGVVDPFLKTPVGLDERFWLFLYPNTVTSLRHVWTHPAFTTKVPQETPNG